MATGSAIFKTAQNVLQVTVNGQWDAPKKISNVHHWVGDQNPTSADCATAARTILNAWQDQMMDGMLSAYEVLDASWINLTSVTSPSGSIGRDEAKPIAGALSVAPLPQNCAVLVRKMTAEGGRKAKNGRMYLVSSGEQETTDIGHLTPTFQNTIQQAATAWYDTVKQVIVASATLTYCVPHWYGDNKPDPEVGGVWAAQGNSTVTSLIVDDVIATQRRRLR